MSLTGQATNSKVEQCLQPVTFDSGFWWLIKR